MATDDIREAAKAEVRRREWASLRGKATRLYIKEHPECREEFDKTGSISDDAFPEYVTKASVIMELGLRARRRETTRAVRKWEKEHPEEAKRIKEEALRDYRLPDSGKKTRSSSRGR